MVAKSDPDGYTILIMQIACGESRLTGYKLVNAVGRVADTSIALARLLYSGHLLKFPGIELVLAHGQPRWKHALCVSHPVRLLALELKEHRWRWN